MKFGHFFSSILDSNLQEKLDRTSVVLPGCHTLLSGPPRSGKTSLLFQHAYSCCVANQNARVLFICKRSKLEKAPPCLPPGADIHSEPYRRISLRYLHNDYEIRKLCAGITFLGFTPTLIVVDDFFDFFSDSAYGERFGNSRARESSMVKTLALLHDTANFASDKLSPHVECELLVSDTSLDEGPRLLYLYMRWLPLVLTIKSCGHPGFQLTVFRSAAQVPQVNIFANYTVSQRTLKLESVQV